MANYQTSVNAAPLEFDPTLMLWPSRPFAIDTTHFFMAYGGAASDGFAEIFTVNTSTWTVTTAAARLEHDTQNGTFNSVVQMDTNHFVDFFLGGAATLDGFAQTFTVNTTTWEVTTAAAKFLFDTDVGSANSALKIDSNHVINFWRGVGSDGFVQVFDINTTSWEVTTAAAQLEFETDFNQYNSAVQIDTNHFINFWSGELNDGYVQVFEVNTTTWAVTTAAARLEFDTTAAEQNSSAKIDDNHFINFWGDATFDGFVQVFEVNTTTWAVTTAAASLEFETDNYRTNSQNSVYQIDANHFFHAWAGPDTGASTAFDGFCQVFEVNTTTWEVTTASIVHEFELAQAEYNSIAPIPGTDNQRYIIAFAGGGDDGFIGVLNAFPINAADTFSDNFDDNALDLHNWENWGGAQVVETGQQLVVTIPNATADYYGLETTHDFDFTGSRGFVEVVSISDVTPDELEVEFQCIFDADNRVFFVIGGSTLIAYEEVAGVTTNLVSDTYSATDHKWLQIRESGGTTFWEVSPDGQAGNWTTFHSKATPITMTSNYYNVDAGCWDTSHGEVVVTFDNFNVEPAAPSGTIPLRMLMGAGA